MGREWVEADDMMKAARLAALASAPSTSNLPFGQVSRPVFTKKWSCAEKCNIHPYHDQLLEHMQLRFSQK